jgi:hypothetical protein
LYHSEEHRFGEYVILQVPLSFLSLRTMKNLFLFALGIILLWAGINLFQNEKNDNTGNTVQNETSERQVHVSREPSVFASFGKQTLKPDYYLDGGGIELEAPEFFEADIAIDTLLLVSAKQSNNIEVWSFPFQNTDAKMFELKDSPNGLVIDQATDTLYATNSKTQTVESYALPSLAPLQVLGEDILESGENNVDILTLPDGTTRLYATDNNEIFGFDLGSKNHIVTFKPKVESIEEILADSKHQILYVPDEQGSGSDVYEGGAILAFHPDGQAYTKDGSNVFAEGLYGGDGEGISLYRCLNPDGDDTGKGFIVSVDQQTGIENGFEFFDRETWKHLGTLHLEGVEQTDGIDISERPLPGFPQGIFAAANYDKNVAITSWTRVIEATGLSCPK